MRTQQSSVEWYTSRGTARRSTLVEKRSVSNGAKKNKRRPLATHCLSVLCGTCFHCGSKIIQMSDQGSMQEERNCSVHCYCDILALGRKDLSQLPRFCNNVVEPSPVARDEFRAATRGSTSVEDEDKVGGGAVGPQWR